MDAPSPCTPLVALEGVAIDIETTGLDPASARVIQLAAIRLTGMSVLSAAPADYLVNPGVAIPPVSTAIHGITDEKVADAPAFAEIWPAFADYLGRRVIVGYRTGFDLAVLRRECALAGMAWRDPPRLCVRTLALCVAPPTLADYSLEGLCRWLEVTVTNRHSALGDARAAADIWARLVPMLRQKGIRTLGEAVAAGAGLNSAEANAALFSKAPEPDMLAPSVAATSRLDSYAYSHRLRDVMSAPPVFAPGTMTVREAARLLIERKISSVLVEEAGQGPGIVTERDLLRAVAADQDDAPIGRLAGRPLKTVAANAHLYRAIGRMGRLGIRHLAVTEPDGRIAGLVTPRDLLRDRATEAIVLGDEIQAAGDAAALAAGRAKLVPLARALLADGMDARGICAVISAELCALTRRAAELAEMRMAAEGRGSPPVPYAVLVLGSGGRGESLLAPDQDNAIVYERGEAGGPVDAWFAALGGHLADTLDVAGIPYCKGGVMARNPEWRKSVEDWHATVDGWIRRSNPRDLLNVDIFFDAIPVHGDATLGDEVWKYAYRQGQSSAIFQKLLTELARSWRSPLGLLGGFRAEKGDRTDFKLGGLMPIFTGARVLSIRHGIWARSTPERLRGVAQAGGLNADAAETVLAAHETILKTVLAQQLTDARDGIALSNSVETARMEAGQKARLRQAVKDISLLIDAISEARL